MTEQVSNIISKVRNYHQQLGREYLLLAEEGRQPAAVSLVLNYLSDKEQEIVKVLDSELDFENFANIYQTWLKEKPSSLEDLFQASHSQPIDDKLEVFEALQLTVIRQHQCVIDMYQQLAEICPMDSLSEYFDKLAQREKVALEKMVDNINQCMQM